MKAVMTPLKPAMPSAAAAMVERLSAASTIEPEPWRATGPRPGRNHTHGARSMQPAIARAYFSSPPTTRLPPSVLAFNSALEAASSIDSQSELHPGALVTIPQLIVR